MKVQLKGRVIKSNVGKNGVTYVDMIDVGTGGQVKVSLPTSEDIKPDSLLDLNVEIKPGMGKYGLYLSVERNLSGGQKAS